MNNIAIIPARSGSKGLNDKNIKELYGKPMMAYTIEAALKSGLFHKIFVSTDSKQYVDIAKQYGEEASFLRPTELSGDTVIMWDVIQNVIEHFEVMDLRYDTITILQPTSPLREAQDIIEAFRMFIEKGAKAVVSVCEMENSPLWSNVLKEDRKMNGFKNKNIIDMPRQMLPKYYRINGAIYIVRREKLKDLANLYEDECYAYIMPKNKSIDIDDETDFFVASKFLQINHGGQNNEIL